MDKFFVWFGLYRKPIGYTVGCLNILLGLSYALAGEFGHGLLWVVIGGMIIFDTKEFK